MINLTQPVGTNWPSKFMLIPQFTSSLPELAQAYDHHRIAPTSAVGTTLEAICGTIGEFLERRHFFNEVIPDKLLTLSDMVPIEAEDAYSAALMQTAQEKLRPSIRSHQFSCNQVFNLFSHAQVYAPSVFISLSNYDFSEDIGFLPSRDTTGCAAHLRLDAALDGALKELIERQSLLRYWITKQVQQELITMENVKYLKRDVQELIKNLQKSGSLKIYDITIPGFPGYAVISLYGADDSHIVQYCTGLSYSYSAVSAIEKSILELWQSYAFLYYFKVGGYDIEDISDNYQRHFWLSNKQETFILMTKEKPLREVLLTDFLARPEATRHELESHLKTITKNIFCYARSESLKDILIWYVRIFSPDLFIHMDFSSPINQENSISSECPIVYADRISSMVPFP